MKKLVIFDLDGTLLNTIGDLAYAANSALNLLGYPPHTTEEYKLFAGNGVNKLLERSLPVEARSEEVLLKFKKEFILCYDKHNTDFTAPYPGISKLLQDLQQANIMLAVTSNKYQVATEKTIKYYFENIKFAAVYGARENTPIKPDPTVVYDVLEQTKISDKSKVLYVGDSCVDMQTALNAGIDSCGVTWGFRSRTELEQFNPQYLVEKAEDILEIVKNNSLKKS